MSAATTIAAYAAIASAAVTAVKAFTAKDGGGGMSLPPPAAPTMAPTLNSPQIDAAGEMERRKAAAAGGIMENIRTSPLGDQSIASTTGKQLLGN